MNCRIFSHETLSALLFWLIRSFSPSQTSTQVYKSDTWLPGGKRPASRLRDPAVILMLLREKAVVLWLTGKRKSSFSCLADLLSGNPPIRKITSYVMPCMIP